MTRSDHEHGSDEEAFDAAPWQVAPADETDAGTFGPYRLLEVLGRGGVGEVWRAHDTVRGRTVALKLLARGWADVPAFRARFRREAHVTAGLISEHVIPIHDYGEIDGRLFIDMRLVEGGDLARALAGNPAGLGAGYAAGLCAQVADGLDAAHRVGLIHRDVKPSNVLLADDALGQRAYLVDFGIAKLAEDLTGTATTELTAAGAALGTPAYMAPELFEAAGRAGPASDVYALGCVLHEMLTGRPAFTAPTAVALMFQHMQGTPPAPSSVRPELAPFDPVLARALAKDPAQRHPAAGALARDAVEAAARCDHAQPARRRRRLLLVAATVAVVVVVAVVLGLVAPWSRTPLALRDPGPAVQTAVALEGPQSITISPDGRRAYVGQTDGIAVVDLATTSVISTVRGVGVNPNRIAISPDGRRAYVADTGYEQEAQGHVVRAIDTATNRVTATIGVGTEPLGLVLTPDGRRLFVSNSGSVAAPDNRVSVVDTATDVVTATVIVPPGPNHPSISPDGRAVYVPSYGSQTTPGSTVTVIDTGTYATTTLPAGDLYPDVTLAAPDGRHVYVVCNGPGQARGSVQVIDTATRAVTRLGDAPLAFSYADALTPDGRTLVVPESGTEQAPASTVAIIDTAGGQRRTAQVAGRPSAAAVGPDGSVAWVVSDAGELWRVPLATA